MPLFIYPSVNLFVSNFVSALYILNPFKDFHDDFGSNVHLSETMSRMLQIAAWPSGECIGPVILRITFCMGSNTVGGQACFF
jgi:hypothetical protein